MKKKKFVQVSLAIHELLPILYIVMIGVENMSLQKAMWYHEDLKKSSKDYIFIMDKAYVQYFKCYSLDSLLRILPCGNLTKKYIFIP